MDTHHLAGKLPTADLLIDLPRLVSSYYTTQPDPENPEQRVSFGTSGHRGTSLSGSFNEAHIMAICQSIAEYRKTKGLTGPLFVGMDTHALSEPAMRTSLEVFAANNVILKIQAKLGYTPTPVISHAILNYNRGRRTDLADGIVITPSHNPPEDGGFKYNPPTGGPADAEITNQIQERANNILMNKLKDVRRIPYNKALNSETTIQYDYLISYVNDLINVINMKKIAATGLKIGVDPLGGAGIRYWDPIANIYGLNLEITNRNIDHTFRFMTVDHDGKIRMDCSSPYAMASLIKLKNNFDIAFGNDPDFDRHGIVTHGKGLLNPNHYLAVAIDYLFTHRDNWSRNVAIGKTLVSSSMIDHVAKSLHRELCEMPVGFKHFVSGLFNGTLGFCGEESAGASFLRLDGSVWTTDKDGFILDLLAAEILASTGKDPAEHYQALEEKFGESIYERIDVLSNPEEKVALGKFDPTIAKIKDLAGDEILSVQTHAPCNGLPINGIKVITKNGWFAARPSGTENVYKIYSESFKGRDHLKQIQSDAQILIKSSI